MKPTPLLLLPSGFPEKNTIFLFSVMNLPSPNHHDSAKPNMPILHLSISFSMITNCHVVSPCTFHVAMYNVFRKGILFPSTIEVCNDMLHTKGFGIPLSSSFTAWGVLSLVDLSSPVSFGDPFGPGVSPIGTIPLACVSALIIMNLNGETAVGGKVLLPGDVKKSPFLLYDVLLHKV